MKNLVIMLTVCTFTFLTSCMLDPCSSKSSFLKHHEKFVNNTIEAEDVHSTEKWEELESEYNDLMNTCYDKYKEEMTREERKEFLRQATKFHLNRIKSDIGSGTKELKKELDKLFDEDFGEYINDFKVEFNEIFDEDFKEEISEIFDEEFKENLKDAMNELKEGLKDFGKELKEILEDAKEEFEK